MNDQHYFASTAFFWVTDATLQGAIAKMKKRYRAEDAAVKKSATVLIYLVPGDQTRCYDIESFRPLVVDTILVASEPLFPEMQDTTKEKKDE